MNQLNGLTSFEKELMNTTLLAGRLLMASGAETSRVEGTMDHILKASNQGEKHKDYDVYVLLNAVFVRLKDSHTSLQQIPRRGNDLGRINEVNQVSRDYTGGAITLLEMSKRLKAIDESKRNPFNKSHLLASAILGGSVVFIYGGGLRDFLPALLAGFCSYVVYHLVSSWLDVPFASEFMATLCGGLVGSFFAPYFGALFSMVTIGAVIPIVPGIAITNAMRDIMDRHYLTGMIRFLECACISAALGGGIGVVYLILN